MNISGQLTREDYLKAQRLHGRRVWWERLLSYAAILAFWGGYASAMIHRVAEQGLGEIWDFLWFPILILGGELLYYYVLLPTKVRNRYEQFLYMFASFEREITPAGLISTDENGQTEDQPWQDFQRWKENRDLLLLYLTDTEFIIIPRRFCSPDQMDVMHGYLRENHVAQAGTVTRRSRIIAGVLLCWLLIGSILQAALHNHIP